MREQRGKKESVVEELLREIGREPAAPASSDLVSRTIRHVRDWIVIGDLLRLITFEGLWQSRTSGRGEAHSPEERQDA